MKSCPTCNRTFENALTFCLVDGSILSAPFDEAPPPQRFDRDSAPARTEILPSAPIAADANEALPNITQPSPIPKTVAATPAERVPQPAVETMRTLKPQVTAPGLHGRVPSHPSHMEASPGASRGVKAALIALGIVVLVATGLVAWFELRPGRASASANTSPAPPAKPTANKGQPTGASFIENVNGTQIEMIAIPGGTFLMGSPAAEAGRDRDEGPQSEVTVAKLYLSKYEVTQAQYQAVMNTNPSNFKGDNLPVDSVSWDKAEEFCRKLSKITKREYRLPTEAEWEYASRAGSPGAISGIIDATTWFSANAGGRTHPVGQKHPNDFGLYDMNGNVWEWCQSKYQPYPYKADDGRENVQEKGTRVMRGGSWENDAASCRSAYRRQVIPNVRATIGFRVGLPGN